MPPPGTQEPDLFGIQINYTPRSDAPSRVFNAMGALIECFQEIDGFLAQSAVPRLQPITLLENIEAGSLRVWLRNVLQGLDDEALKSGDWKKMVGVYLVKAKRLMIDWTNEKATVSFSQADLSELQRKLQTAAEETDVVTLPMYSPIPSRDLVRSIELISGSVGKLESETVFYLSSQEAVELERVNVSTNTLTDLLVRESLSSEVEMILKVKRPDFLGASRWEFRHESRSFEAKLSDEDWLQQFRNGSVTLRPGDALRCRIRSLIRYDHDGEVVDSRHDVLLVREVIHATRYRQVDLFRRPEDHE